jgi:hypothetical protein
MIWFQRESRGVYFLGSLASAIAEGVIWDLELVSLVFLDMGFTKITSYICFFSYCSLVKERSSPWDLTSIFGVMGWTFIYPEGRDCS